MGSGLDSVASMMANTREGDLAVATVKLLKNFDNFGYEKAEALQYFEQTMQTISTGWGNELAGCGYPRDLLPTAVLRGT